ncbi:GAF domain-containing protein [Paracoccus haeundaensis]|uniref:GAF domain-containing protein n=1 Tax=Paracoccus haeundaensis TaxID=225362 RepID=A0A5C4R119_9RHOB|nr:GAF domain-containing protein [Paracoccus haeundaensis]TNH37606.1 GAF domain-containing protein [Paracoccus haeundaensis]
MALSELADVGMFSHDKTPVFDRVVETARMLLDSKISLISLIDEDQDRQFFKAETGLSLPWSTRRETSLTHSLCKIVAAQEAPLAVNDARAETRFKDHAAVSDFGVVAYLGVPIGDDAGKAIGALCVMDTEPRSWSEDDVDIMVALGTGVSVQIKLMLEGRKKELAEQQHAEPDIAAFAAFDDLPGAIVSYIQASDGREVIGTASGETKAIWEIESDQLADDFGGVFANCMPEDIIGGRVAMGNSAARLIQWQHEWHATTPSGAVKRLSGYGHPEALPDGSIRWDVVVRDVTHRVHPLSAAS